MTHGDLLIQIRALVGSPAKETVADRQFEPHVDAALDFLAEQLDYALREDTVYLTLEADQQRYPLPASVNTVRWISHRGVKLEPRTTWEWDVTGSPWREPNSGIPLEYAIEGRQIIFDLPPSAATVTEHPRVTINALVNGLGLSRSFIPDLPDADVRLLAEVAAQRFCAANPDKEGLNRARDQRLEAFIQRDLAQAKTRHGLGGGASDLQPRFEIHTSRQGVAR